MPNRTSDPRGKSQIVKRNVRVDAYKTSASLESAFWDGLTEIADAHGTTISRLITAIDSERRDRQQTNLSSAIRLFVLDYYSRRL
jgi:predicted DNA-binding ribbon-helix-helix protein